MLALLAAVVIAQTQATIQIGGSSKDSVSQAHGDSIANRREIRRDSLRAVAHARDSTRRRIREAKRMPMTTAVMATAFKDAGARTLLLAAREARLSQDSTLNGYDASAYERLSVGMGFRKIGRDRLLMRSERAAHVQWQRGKGALIDVKGQRSAFPMIEGIGDGDMDLGADTDIPYVPGRETLWIGSGLAKADVSESEMIHPLARGAEAYYTYESGDSVSFQLPGGQRIEIKELRIRPRQPKWNVVVGSLWFDTQNAHLVRAVYRMAQEMDIMAVAKEANEEDGDDDDDDIPTWVKPMITPMKAKVSVITVEYGLHEGKFWLPRAQSVEGDAQVSFMHIPFKLEQRYTYASVNGDEPMPDVAVSVADTASDSASPARRERRREECKTGTVRVRSIHDADDEVPVIVRTPCDSVALAHSPELPKSIYDEGEEVFGSAERESLIAEALTLTAQSGFAPQPIAISYGLPFTRFNRIEGISTAVAIDKVLGEGYATHALLRLGVADWSPNAELSVDRTDGRRKIGVGVFRRLVASNDWGEPLGFSSSVSALLFGKDGGFYYRAWGAELTGEKDYGFISNWRLFAEQHFDATVQTEFALLHPGRDKSDLTNIDAQNGTVVGLGLLHHSSVGLDPHGFRALTDLKVEGAAGSFDYTRGLLQSTLSHGLGPLDWALTLGGGTSGGQLPIQKNFFLGGVQTVRGQRPGAEVGDTFWMSSFELGQGSTGFRKIVFGDLGWAGQRDNFSHPGRPLSGAGVGASFMDGLIRIDVAKGIYPEKSWRTNMYLEARF